MPVLDDADVDCIAELQLIIELAFGVFVELHFLHFEKVQAFLQALLLELVGELLHLADIDGHALPDVMVDGVGEVQVALEAHHVLTGSEVVVAQSVVHCKQLHLRGFVQAGMIGQMLDGDQLKVLRGDWTLVECQVALLPIVEDQTFIEHTAFPAEPTVLVGVLVLIATYREADATAV